jgi:2-methylisocitrate lyase-like PEP mutase family enzyme
VDATGAAVAPADACEASPNTLRAQQTPSLAELAALGVARVSWGPYLYRYAMARFEDQLASLRE